MNCQSCIHWKIIETHGSTRTDEGMKANQYSNCWLNKKIGDQFAAFKFVHATFGCDKHEAKTNLKG